MNIGFQTSGLSGFTRVAYLWRRHASAVLWIAMAALLPTACSDDAEQCRKRTDIQPLFT